MSNFQKSYKDCFCLWTVTVFIRFSIYFSASRASSLDRSLRCSHDKHFSDVLMDFLSGNKCTVGEWEYSFSTAQVHKQVVPLKSLEVYLSIDPKCGGGSGFFLVCEDFGRMFDNSFPACAFFFLFFFCKCRLAHTHLFHSLGQDQSTVAQQAETTVTKCSLASCASVH